MERWPRRPLATVCSPAPSPGDARGFPVLAIALNTVLATLLLIANRRGERRRPVHDARAPEHVRLCADRCPGGGCLPYARHPRADDADGSTARRRDARRRPALAVSIWMIGATGKPTVFDGVLLVLIGIPVYLADQWRRARGGTAEPAPADPPSGAPSAAAREGD